MSGIELPLYDHVEADLLLGVAPGPNDELDLWLPPEPVDSGSAFRVGGDGTLLLLAHVRAKR